MNVVSVTHPILPALLVITIVAIGLLFYFELVAVLLESVDQPEMRSSSP